MKECKTLDGALCAGVRTADALGAAPASGKKKYVSPTMQVIPLGPQRLLATSNAPVSVYVSAGFDWYYGVGDAEELRLYREIDYNLKCEDFAAATFLARFRGQKRCATFRRKCCFGNFDGPYVSFSGPVPADWSAEDFLANVQFTGGCGSSLTYLNRFTSEIYDVTGIYKGRGVEITIDFLVSDPGGELSSDDC